MTQSPTSAKTTQNPHAEDKGQAQDKAQDKANGRGGQARGVRSWNDVRESRRLQVPEGLWLRCPGCEQLIYRKQMEANLHVCPECGHHFRIGARERIDQLADVGSFEAMFEDLRPADPLGFVDAKPYPARLKAEQTRTGRADAVLAGRAFVKGRAAMLCSLDLSFMMGSMGSVVGEVLTRAIEHATEQRVALVVVSCSGGARMQESTLSLMQMAKTSAALGRLDDAGGLFLSVLADPTTGGVTASFAMLGDVIIAEPGALIGFAGPRVIRQTIRQELPEGFQRAEFCLAHGLIDKIAPRADLRTEIARLIDYAGL